MKYDEMHEGCFEVWPCLIHPSIIWIPGKCCLLTFACEWQRPHKESCPQLAIGHHRAVCICESDLHKFKHHLLSKQCTLEIWGPNVLFFAGRRVMLGFRGGRNLSAWRLTFSSSISPVLHGHVGPTFPDFLKRQSNQSYRNAVGDQLWSSDWLCEYLSSIEGDLAPYWAALNAQSVDCCRTQIFALCIQRWVCSPSKCANKLLDRILRALAPDRKT